MHVYNPFMIYYVRVHFRYKNMFLNLLIFIDLNHIIHCSFAVPKSDTKKQGCYKQEEQMLSQLTFKKKYIYNLLAYLQTPL